MVVRVQSETFDSGQELTIFSQIPDAGAVVTFTGIVRDVAAGLDHLEIEHYPAMTQKTLEAIESDAVKRWDLSSSLVIHRFGKLKPGEVIMMVATAAAHRRAAFEAAEYLMDYLKSRAPFWKKEHTRGSAAWVDANVSDEEMLKRWQSE